jgi:hypothetical protein
MNLGILKGGDTVTLVGHRATLDSELVYTSPNNVVITVPAGFVFDGASIPDFAWSVVGHPFLRGYRRPSAVHDYLMKHKTIPSHEAHRYFYNCLRLEGVSRWRAVTLFNSVRLFGPRF